MKSFRNYITEERKTIFRAAQALMMKQDDIEYDVLCVHPPQPHALLYVADHRHPDYTALISTEDLDLESIKFRIHPKIQNRIPISNFLYQQRNNAPIKKVEYHDQSRNLKESIAEDLDKTSFNYYQTEYRRIRRRDDVNAKLNLILEIMFSSEAERRIFH